jgi:hypothetical protein
MTHVVDSVLMEAEPMSFLKNIERIRARAHRNGGVADSRSHA